MTRLSLVLGAIIIMGLPSPRDAAAQDTGTLSGTVVDASGQVLPGATVTLANEATGGTRTMVTSDRGEFTFRAVQPGTYTVTVELSGFRRYERQHNVVNASSQLSLGDVKLEIGTLSEAVTVTAQGTIVETKNSDYSGLLTATQIQQIQIKGRDVVNLLRLLPGVHYENDIDAMGDSFGSQIPNIEGQRRNWNQVTIDGLNGNELSGTNRMNSSLNLDAIAEVKVLLNTYKAEFGHSGGANIEIVSKSGSADYHGSGYWYASCGTRRTRGPTVRSRTSIRRCTIRHRRRDSTSRRSSTDRASRSIRSPVRRSIRSTLARSCRTPASKTTEW